MIHVKTQEELNYYLLNYMFGRDIEELPDINEEGGPIGVIKLITVLQCCLDKKETDTFCKI